MPGPKGEDCETCGAFEKDPKSANLGTCHRESKKAFLVAVRDKGPEFVAVFPPVKPKVDWCFEYSKK